MSLWKETSTLALTALHRLIHENVAPPATRSLEQPVSLRPVRLVWLQPPTPLSLDLALLPQLHPELHVLQRQPPLHYHVMSKTKYMVPHERPHLYPLTQGRLLFHLVGEVLVIS